MSAPDDWDMVVTVALGTEFLPQRDIAAPRDLLSPQRINQIRRDLSEERAKEAQIRVSLVYYERRARILQGNRAALGAVLWACGAWKEWPEHSRSDDWLDVGHALERLIRQWGVPQGVRVPQGFESRRRWVEAWGTEQWWAVVSPPAAKETEDDDDGTDATIQKTSH